MCKIVLYLRRRKHMAKECWNNVCLVEVLMTDKVITGEMVKSMYGIIEDNNNYFICDLSMGSWIKGLIDKIRNKECVVEYKNTFIEYEYLILRDFLVRYI